jgi:hypothetical protein
LDHRVIGKQREGIKIRVGRGCAGGGEREDGLIEHHMARDEDPLGGKVKATVPLVIRGVPEEDTESRTGCQFVWSGGCGVRVTRTPEDAKVIVPRRGTEKSVVWCGSGTGNGRKTVKEIGGGVQALSPEASRKRCLEQKSAHGVVSDANHALSLAILRGGIRARHAQLDTVREEEGTGCNGTVQIIRAQVQKQSPKRSNSQT